MPRDILRSGPLAIKLEKNHRKFCGGNNIERGNNMPKEQRKFADDGWAIWVDGDDTSTVYINDWLNPRGKSYVDIALRILGVRVSKSINVYVPFRISKEEIEDVSLRFNDTRTLQATFSAACIIDYMKNPHTSEIAYNGKTVDVVHISTFEYTVSPLAEGTLITLDLAGVQEFLDNDEAYFLWRMPHKSLDAVFKPRMNVDNLLGRIRDLVTTPVVSEKYGYSVRVNEARLLPEQITRIGGLHRQKLKKAVITISIDESYELNDVGCYRIHRMEENLYDGYLPTGYDSRGVITYHWYQSREDNLKGQYNFYYSITKESVSRASMFFYMLLLLSIALASEILGAVITNLMGL